MVEFWGDAVDTADPAADTGPSGQAGRKKFGRADGLAAIERLEQVRKQWEQRYRQAEQASGELAARRFVGQSADRAVRVVLDGGGQVAEVRIDRRRAEGMNGAALAAAVIEADGAGRRDLRRATAQANDDVLGVDAEKLSGLAAHAAASTPRRPVTGDADVDGVFAELHAFQARSREATDSAATATGTARSTNRLVSATCNATEVLELRVDDGLAHPRRLSVAEQSIAEAVRGAYAAVAGQQNELLGSLSVLGVQLGDLMTGRLDPARLVGQLAKTITNRTTAQGEI